MKNSNTFTSDNFQKGCLHSQICSTGTDDLIYRKAYKGDWGDWDEMPETTYSNSFEISDSENSLVSDCPDSTGANENSYL